MLEGIGFLEFFQDPEPCLDIWLRPIQIPQVRTGERHIGPQPIFPQKRQRGPNNNPPQTMPNHMQHRILPNFKLLHKLLHLLRQILPHFIDIAERVRLV